MKSRGRYPGQSDEGLEPLFKLEEVSALLRRSHWTLRQDVKAGRVRCVRFGRRILIEAAEIRRLIEAARL